MGVVNDLVDEWTALANARLPWEKYWRDIAMYVLPQTEGFDRMLSTNASMAINSVVSTPVASEKSKNLYDMTSLWGIERLTAGMLSLKTPETEHWHDMGLDSYFGAEPTHEEQLALERLRNYQFKVRANPKSGFWGAHKAAVRSMCGFGDGWMFVEENMGAGPRVPYRYEYAPLPELYPAVGPDGLPNRMTRVFGWSAYQVATKFQEKAGKKVIEMANDPQKKHNKVRVMHAVRPRDDNFRNAIGVRGAAFESHYCLPDEKHHIGESGFYEFPYVRYAWSNTGTRPFSEGPVAYAIGEIKSLNEMAKNELIGAQMVLRPPLGTYGKNFMRLNFNAGAVNPGLVNGDGRQLFAPLNTGVRPDFAQAVLEVRRNQAREMLYLNLWQIMLQDTEDTATAAIIKAQEKGELLGPVGISLNEGLSSMVDREVGILGRKRAFDAGSPLEMPESLADANVSPSFNSPLDRLRRMGELVGMQRLVEFATLLAGGDPNQAAKIMARFDVDEMLDQARDILGAPVSVLRDKDVAEESRGQTDQMQGLMAALQTMRAGGEAAQAVGTGGAALAQGAEAAANSPAMSDVADLMRGGGAAAMQQLTGRAA